MNSNLASSCEEDQCIQEREDGEGFELLLNKHMNITALKKTKSSNSEPKSNIFHGIKGKMKNKDII